MWFLVGWGVTLFALSIWYAETDSRSKKRVHLQRDLGIIVVLCILGLFAEFVPEIAVELGSTIFTGRLQLERYQHFEATFLPAAVSILAVIAMAVRVGLYAAMRHHLRRIEELDQLSSSPDANDLPVDAGEIQRRYFIREEAQNKVKWLEDDASAMPMILYGMILALVIIGVLFLGLEFTTKR